MNVLKSVYHCYYQKWKKNAPFGMNIRELLKAFCAKHLYEFCWSTFPRSYYPNSEELYYRKCVGWGVSCCKESRSFPRCRRETCRKLLLVFAIVSTLLEKILVSRSYCKTYTKVRIRKNGDWKARSRIIYRETFPAKCANAVNEFCRNQKTQKQWTPSEYDS